MTTNKNSKLLSRKKYRAITFLLGSLFFAQHVFSATYQSEYEGSHFVGYEGTWATFETHITADIGTHNFEINSTPSGGGEP